VNHILDTLGTIRRLEEQFANEPDPRVRIDLAETIDLLEISFRREVEKHFSKGGTNEGNNGNVA
jgi:hypothetical protein